MIIIISLFLNGLEREMSCWRGLKRVGKGGEGVSCEYFLENMNMFSFYTFFSIIKCWSFARFVLSFPCYPRPSCVCLFAHSLQRRTEIPHAAGMAWHITNGWMSHVDILERAPPREWGLRIHSYFKLK